MHNFTTEIYYPFIRKNPTISVFYGQKTTKFFIEIYSSLNKQNFYEKEEFEIQIFNPSNKKRIFLIPFIKLFSRSLFSFFLRQKFTLL